MKLVPSEDETGNYYHDEATGCSVFENTQGDKPRFCAWAGEVDDYAAASRTPWADSMEKAVEFLKCQMFQCGKCGKTRARKEKKKWKDLCKDGGTHDWEPMPMPGKKKTQPGRKINIWFADSQLLEIEEVSSETGNDRASTIRELVALGLKCRRQLDKPGAPGE
ncbi:MAG: hypothetical protein ABIH66_14710 [bacterium]